MFLASERVYVVKKKVYDVYRVLRPCAIWLFLGLIRATPRACCGSVGLHTEA